MIVVERDWNDGFTRCHMRSMIGENKETARNVILYGFITGRKTVVLILPDTAQGSATGGKQLKRYNIFIDNVYIFSFLGLGFVDRLQVHVKSKLSCWSR